MCSLVIMTGYSHNLPVMYARKAHYGRDRTDESKEHIGLRVPRIALRSQEIIGALPKPNGRPPFNEFVGGADCKRNTNHQKPKRLSHFDIVTTDKYFAGNQGRHKTLKEVTDLVIWISAQMQQVLYLKAKRHSCV